MFGIFKRFSKAHRLQVEVEKQFSAMGHEFSRLDPLIQRTILHEARIFGVLKAAATFDSIAKSTRATVGTIEQKRERLMDSYRDRQRRLDAFGIGGHR